MRKLIKKILKEGELDWIQDFETKWDVSNIHLVAGKKFRFNPTSMSTRSGVNAFFGSSKPSGIKCEKNSIWRVIDRLNKGE